jgi:guanylate kinase
MDDSLAAKLEDYRPSAAAVELIKSTRIPFLVGPTGAGKDSLKERLLSTGEYHHIVSHTTRRPRINHGVLEKDGLEYHFIGHEKAEQMLDGKEFVEAKIYSSNLYGTSVKEIQLAHDENKVALTDLEVQGVGEYKAIDPGIMAVFLLPPDFETWQQRLQRRYGDVVDIDDMKLRMQTALDELDQLLNTGYYNPIINDDMEVAFSEIQALVKNRLGNPEKEKAAQTTAVKLKQDISEYLQGL